MYWREEGAKGRVVKDERTRTDFRGEGILRILARLVVWCGGCLRHCRCCCHWRHWVLREKGGVRAVVKAPGRRLFKRRKSPSVIIRKGGIGEQSWNFWNWISAIFLQFTIVWATVPRYGSRGRVSLVVVSLHIWGSTCSWYDQYLWGQLDYFLDYKGTSPRMWYMRATLPISLPVSCT
jgi:hypothetical protein